MSVGGASSTAMKTTAASASSSSVTMLTPILAAAQQNVSVFNASSGSGGGAEHVQMLELMECPHDTFTPLQLTFRLYLVPLVGLFGVVANMLNIRVFSHSKMRCQPVNLFFLALSLSDLFVLVTSSVVFTLPMLAEELDSILLHEYTQYLVVFFYPLALSSLTCSVSLTILVSVHRYLGVCHPFLIRRISNMSAVRAIIATAVVFAFAFNTSRWFEITTYMCFSTQRNMIIRGVRPTPLMLDSAYTLVYRNIAYTLVMFVAPFSVLSFVNVKIVNTLRQSHKLRRQMTYRAGLSGGGRLSDLLPPVENGKAAAAAEETPQLTRILRDNQRIVYEVKTAVEDTSSGSPQAKANGVSGSSSSSKDSSSVSVMLLAITTEFLLFNLLAFANNIVELSHWLTAPSDAPGEPSQLETVLVEVSTLFVNLNCATTLVVYLIFGSKFRVVFCNMFRWLPRSPSRTLLVGGTSAVPMESTTTQLMVTPAGAVQKKKKAYEARSSASAALLAPPPRQYRAMSGPLLLSSRVD